MTTPVINISCQLAYWGLAVGIAVTTTIGYSLSGEMSIKGAIFLGNVALFLLGAMLSWLLCRPSPPLEGVVQNKPATEATRKAGPAQLVRTTSTTFGIGLTSPTPLAGEAELASRKGTWRYERSATLVDSAKAKAVPKKASLRKSTKALASGEEVGKAPAKFDCPRGGVADDLKWIKGIGPKLERIFHSDQVANWNEDEAAWMDANLEGLSGRATRDQWEAQARELTIG